MPKPGLAAKQKPGHSDKEIVAMKIALAIAAVTAACLIPLAVRAVIRRFKEAQATFDILTAPQHEPIIDLGTADDLECRLCLLADEADHVTRLAPVVEFIPGNFTCGRCMENPAMPGSAWCAVCAPIVDQYPSEPIERGGLR